MRRSYVGDVSLFGTLAYEDLVPADVKRLRHLRGLPSAPRTARTPRATHATPRATLRWDEHPDDSAMATAVIPLPVTVSHDRHEGVEIAMVIQAPKSMRPEKRRPRPKELHSKLSLIFEGNRFPEPVHYRNVDCMGIPSLLSPQECKKIIDFAESSMSFRDHFRSRVVDMSYVDFIDPCFANAFWSAGLGWLLRTMKLEDLVFCGINEVIRMQKFVQGGYVSLHSDRPFSLSDGRVSKYSLRIFLNSGSNSDISDSTDFEGGVSIFHVPFKEPVIFTASTGMALFYPQGELCTPQEESEVTFGTKYVLRADVLFRKAQRPELPKAGHDDHQSRIP